MKLLDFINNKLLKKNTKEETAFKTYNREFKVVGVKYNNDDGSSRQEILKAIKEKRKPFNQKLDIAIESYMFKDENALRVTVNNKMIGNISRKDLPFFEKNRERILSFQNLYVGGNDGSYFAKVKVTIKTLN